MPVSSIENIGIHEVWQIICSFKEKLLISGVFKERRQSQTKDWFHTMITDRLMDDFYELPDTKLKVNEFEHEILRGDMTVSQAVENLFPRTPKT